MQKNKTKLSNEDMGSIKINEKLNEYNKKYNGNLKNLTSEEIEDYKKMIGELFEDEAGYWLTNIPPEIAIEMVEDFKTGKIENIPEYVSRYGSFCKELKKENVDPIKITLQYLVQYRKMKTPRWKIKKGANNPNIGLAAPNLLKLVKNVAKEVNNPIYELNNNKLGIKVNTELKQYYTSLKNPDTLYKVKPARYFLNKHNEAESTENNKTIRIYPRLKYTSVCFMDYVKEKFLF
ncbi:MAG: hypothetical protein LBT10_04845 [Methanobrevibacter sp.]|jgi:hypothetical protein|nr:hypothetical protein [Methanobrevibacter sp.]